ncbi:MAG TPA: adenylate/guanylate cyclase domain-containing protein [Geminicoccaceae bacterium]|nr:adenylate/guanylate cyclase domain-containing protein [Geminicoccaceae bacterium]
MAHQDDDRRVAEISRWLIAEARLSLAPLELIDRFCRELVELSVPLWRLRAGQRLANPLASAWGVIWTRDGSGTHEYVVARTTLSTGAYFGSPFQYVVERRQTFRRRLIDLDPERDHEVLHEMAAAGGTDYLAVPLEYGDGSVQGMSLVSDGADGFAERHLELIERLRQPLAAALEPTAMRRSSASLLRTFLGDGPADAVLAGAIRRGDRRHIEAAILFCDLRGFTALSERLSEAALFGALDRYFEAVVEAVRAEGGDVLKFLGDGILAIFPVEAAGGRAAACHAALRAVDHAGERLAGAIATDDTPLAFTATLHVGQVVYGNIGSPDRLDFTVLGPAVNLVSRLEGLAKELGRPLLCSAAFADALGIPLAALGRFPLKGVAEPEAVFEPVPAKDGPESTGA